MHVLTVICSGGWMPEHLSEGWRSLGCTVQQFCYGTHMGKSWSEGGRIANRETNQRLLDTARRLKQIGQLDLIFAVIYDDVLEVGTAKALRTLGVPMVNYHVDLVGQWYRILRTGPYFDRVACAHHDHWLALKRAGIRPWYMPMAALPHSPMAQSKSPHDFNGVLYLGSPWPFRRAILAALAKANVPIRTYGHNWNGIATGGQVKKDASNTHSLRKNIHDLAHYLVPRLREEGLRGLTQSLAIRMRKPRGNDHAMTSLPSGAIQGAYESRDFSGLVRGAAINLGFTHFGGRPGTASERRQVRLRDFEIPMAGGFYLAQDCEQLRELFNLGEHVVGWSDQTDLIEKVRYYLAHPTERIRISEAGRLHCLSCHTWAHRFKALLADLGMQPPQVTG